MMKDGTEMKALPIIAREMHISESTLRRAAQKGHLRATKAGPRAWLTTRQAVNEWRNNPDVHRTGRPKA